MHMNIVKMMIPKIFTVFLRESNTVRQGHEIFREHGYTAIPVIDEKERYVGCVTEGDFLRHIMNVGSLNMKDHEKCFIGDIVRKDFVPALDIGADYDTVISSVLNQNFVPIVDSRGALCGILTRKSVIDFLSVSYKANAEIKL